MSSQSTTTTTTHLASVLPSKGSPLEVLPLPTPTPGPGELLVAVKSIALNPVDGYIRNLGFFVSSYPTVLGSDLSGEVLSVGPDMSAENKEKYKVGTRVCAFASGFYKGFDPKYGAFQERVVVPWENCCPLPSSSSATSSLSLLSWNEAAILPMAVEVPLSTWELLGIPLNDDDGETEMKKDQALLIWGASSSVGTMGVQSARLLLKNKNNPFARIYATCSAGENSDYVREELGADRVFDYRDPDVVGQIVEAARGEGLTVRKCYLAAGKLAGCQGVLRAFLPPPGGEKEEGKGKTASMIGSAPIVPQDAEVIEGIETIFVQPSQDPVRRSEQINSWMGGGWLRENLERGSIKPSPKVTVVGKGLENVNAGLDRLLKGVSCTKLVVEVEE